MWYGGRWLYKDNEDDFLFQFWFISSFKNSMDNWIEKNSSFHFVNCQNFRVPYVNLKNFQVLFRKHEKLVSRLVIWICVVNSKFLVFHIQLYTAIYSYIQLYQKPIILLLYVNSIGNWFYLLHKFQMFPTFF